MRIFGCDRGGGCKPRQLSLDPTSASRAHQTCRSRQRGARGSPLLHHRTTTYRETRSRVSCFSSAADFLETSPTAQYLFSKTPEAARLPRRAVCRGAMLIRDNESPVLLHRAAFCCA